MKKIKIILLIIFILVAIILMYGAGTRIYGRLNSTGLSTWLDLIVFIISIIVIFILLISYIYAIYKQQKINFYRTIRTLTSIAEKKDKYFEGHSYRVEEYAELIAHEMGLWGIKLESIRIAALLHDIGKIAIGDEILNKPDKLNKEEFKTVITHPKVGAEILEGAAFSQNVCECVLYHHERYDGKGYPGGLSKESIPLLARILAVADAYDAMTSERSYRSAYQNESVLRILQDEAGAQFDPDVVNAAIKAFSDGERQTVMLRTPSL